MLKFVISIMIVLFYKRTPTTTDVGSLCQKKIRLLIISYDALGDFLISTPLLEQIIKDFPYADVDLLCSDRNMALAKKYGWFTKLWTVQLNTRFWDIENWKTIFSIKSAGYDLVINLFDEPDEAAVSKIMVVSSNSKLISLNLRKKSKYQNHLLNIFSGFFTNRSIFTVPVETPVHFLERLCQICLFWRDSVDIDYRYRFPDIPILQKLPISTLKKIYFHPFGSQKNNCLDLGVITSVLQSIDGYEWSLPAIKNKFTGENLGQFSDLAIEFISFFDLASHIKSCDLVVSVDTSTAHLAVALGKPLFLIRADETWRQNFDPQVGIFKVFKSETNKIESVNVLKLQIELKRFISLV